MNLLLDTHIWIWSLLDPSRLSAKVRRTLRDPAASLWLSPISTWEFLMLVERSRIEIDMPADDWLDQAERRAPMMQAPLTHAIARESRRIALPHEDPADRFLAATAKVLGLTLVTADRRLGQAPDLDVLVNR